VTPPFREPHHTTSLAGLIGGGSGVPRPGELSLAHHGILFMDEFLETPRWILDALREPLENGRVILNRAVGSITYPCRVQLVAATNPCPCGYVTSSARSCRCRPDMVTRYRSRLSGPLLDRIDVQIELQALAPEELTGPADGEPSGDVAKRVLAARGVAADRWGTTVARAATTAVRSTVTETAIRRLVRAVEVLGFSARAFDRCLRVARTIADLDGVEVVGADQIDEAVAYRLPPDVLR
jgi:magnesium chelatase family protein